VGFPKEPLENAKILKKIFTKGEDLILKLSNPYNIFSSILFESEISHW